ncbi:DUF7475 family protein [Halopenitus persicus]|uniref:DUF7475 family protein n=1 Tax=Halopenitus persicus TaxID=1048396 RepID=UPI0018EE51BD|nr:hypothetical protein [Halopenitus persicus]
MPAPPDVLVIGGLPRVARAQSPEPDVTPTPSPCAAAISGQTLSLREATGLGMGVVDDHLDLETLDRRHRLGIGLAAVTGAIHLVLGMGAPTTPIGVASILAGIGYAGAIVLVLVGYRRRLVAAVGIVYVGSQIVIWYVVNRPASLAAVSPAAMVDKPVQVLLIAVCVAIVRRSGAAGE